jgi:hypothetical protein
LWTPDGEKPVERASEPAREELTEEEIAERMEALREQLASTPVAQIVAQSAYQFFEIAALHLSLLPPQLDEAKLAIDAFGLLVEGLEGRLGPDGDTLKDGLAQLRMAFVQLSQAGAPPTSE